MSARKKFLAGEAIEVQRDVDAAWEPAFYDKPRMGQERSGWHIVKFDGGPPRVVDVLGRQVEMDWVAVPTKRIRVPSNYRRVVHVDRSPLNSSRWCLTLDCGHEHWVTSTRRPSAVRFPCRAEHSAALMRARGRLP
jgi:hypothetical protein